MLPLKSLSVVWVPGLPEYFVTWSSDIKLYHIRQFDSTSNLINELNDDCIRISSNVVADLVGQIVRHLPRYISKVTVQPPVASLCDENTGCFSSIRIAVANAEGKLSYFAFIINEQVTCDIILREFGSKHSRQCHGLSWSNNGIQLAAAYEKARNDYAILVFEVGNARTRISKTKDNSNINNYNLYKNSTGCISKNEFTKASVNIGQGETCNSLAWFPSSSSSNALLASMNGKMLRVFDLRTLRINEISSKVAVSTMTKAVNGICIDGLFENRIASYVDNLILLWDVRNFDKPIVTLSQPKKVTALAWNPITAGLLCCATEASCQLLLHDIHSWNVTSDNHVEPAITRRNLSLVPCTDRSPMISSFTWFSSSRQQCLLASLSDGKIVQCSVTEHMAIDWSPGGLVWPINEKISIVQYDDSDDIVALMKQRVLDGYGSPTSLKGGNIGIDLDIVDKCFTSKSDVKFAWMWLNDCSKLMKNDLLFRNMFSSNVTLPGIRTALLDDKSHLAIKSDIVYLPWSGIDTEKVCAKSVYRSNARQRAIKLCGWGIEEVGGAISLELITKLEIAGHFTRAAALTIFATFDIRQALNILQRGAKHAPYLNTVVMALSGFSVDSNLGLWREMVMTNMENLDDAYLRAMFSFLVSDTLDNVPLCYLELVDRVAISCIYLPDDALVTYLESLWAHLLENNDLHGVLMCGMNQEGIQLLRGFVNCTGDVQSAAWIVAYCMPSQLLLNNEDATRWIEGYRYLLNRWRFWTSRADFDIVFRQRSQNNDSIAPPQVYISCNYCGSDIGNYSKRTSVPFIPNRQHSIKNDSHVHACGCCGKPLPRCSVCLVNMGTFSGLVMNHPTVHRREKQYEEQLDKNIVTHVDKFFTWCQTCRHGGHAAHMLEWFTDHIECPVAGCFCKCNQLDPLL